MGARYGAVTWAMIHEGALQLQNDSQHVVRITLADILRVRIGYCDGQHRSYHTRSCRQSNESCKFTGVKPR